jgi:uncharacterized protein YbcC (UPF0753/DUF2309 family)
MPTASLQTIAPDYRHGIVIETDDHFDIDSSLDQALAEIQAFVPPLWPLRDYVAVNPCVGLTDRTFLDAHRQLSAVRDCDLLMPGEYFRKLSEDGRISARDLAAAISQCVAEYPTWYAGFGLPELTRWLELPENRHKRAFHCRTFAELIDQRQQSSWSSHIVNDITRHCAAHYDEGQAHWASPWEDKTLYGAWREAAQLSRRMDLLGVQDFRKFVATLSANPRRALQEMLGHLKVPSTHWRQFLLAEAFSVAGWASFVRYRVREAECQGQDNDDLVGLLAIRLAYDVALARSAQLDLPLPWEPSHLDREYEVSGVPNPPVDVLARYALQVATEQAYRRSLLKKLSTHSAQPSATSRKQLQIVFCIDVRSEVIRRNLESLDESIETFGFAGFFGMPMRYVPFGCDQGTPQCPVLLQPSFQVHEALGEVADTVASKALQKRVRIRQARQMWKAFQSSATSCFSFVESLGLSYVVKLFTDSMCWTRPVDNAETDGLSSGLSARVAPNIRDQHNHTLDAQRRVDLSEGMLRNLGLTGDFARVVVLCGHVSEVTNNPYRAALDCGACGGHSGAPNARVAAALLNDVEVRTGLAERGIPIPEDTVFVAGVHNTTTDQIELFEPHRVERSHAEDLANIKSWLDEAGQLSRLERGLRLNSTHPYDVTRRSRDWAEVRPEWGLAGNAAFIVAPRSRTAGLNLHGRTFLHNYDYRLDPELKVLELIMTAPMVVTNWINAQYYASTVDPIAFGSGNKVIHNVVGQFGVLQGNGGDLMTGLPWQSIHDGTQLQHEPLRLSVIIDAPRSSLQRIIEKHPLVRDLVTNGWVHLVAWENDQFYDWTGRGTWQSHVI